MTVLTRQNKTLEEIGQNVKQPKNSQVMALVFMCRLKSQLLINYQIHVIVG